MARAKFAWLGDTCAVSAMFTPALTGGFYNLPHGVCNAILLPAVEQYNLIAAPERFADIAKAMGVVTAGMASSGCRSGSHRHHQEAFPPTSVFAEPHVLGVKPT